MALWSFDSITEAHTTGAVYREESSLIRVLQLLKCATHQDPPTGSLLSSTFRTAYNGPGRLG